MRAFAQDRTVAAAFGIDHRRLGLLVGGAAGASAAVAGMIFTLSNSLTPAVAYEWFGIVFAVVILGGIGNLLGTLIAGIGVGVLSGLVSVIWSPSTEPFVLFLAIILALLLRPHGLFARRGVA
jgi:branched-chain amino acid transport system permease protein